MFVVFFSQNTRANLSKEKEACYYDEVAENLYKVENVENNSDCDIGNL